MDLHGDHVSAWERVRGGTERLRVTGRDAAATMLHSDEAGLIINMPDPQLTQISQNWLPCFGKKLLMSSCISSVDLSSSFTVLLSCLVPSLHVLSSLWISFNAILQVQTLIDSFSQTGFGRYDDDAVCSSVGFFLKSGLFLPRSRDTWNTLRSTPFH